MDTPTNARIASEFLTMAASGQVREAYQRHVADGFVHHNAYFPADRQSLLLAMEQSAQGEPNKSFTVRQVIDGGDRVAVLSHLQRAQSDQQYAVVHILRFENNRIVELWDVAQQIPEELPNLLGMF
ncbi:nuclear transport factor 2 family protein [Pseudoxanthomonas dokdonensis]|uniref:Polyketide cyclase n=1 Tax=Pseudoxanthomonas dokdonensis TaxID=344882 RepID=A0A0R0CQC0_9GAMM|nr:nuclear transport factor 2 family protein [Pseudoxanthomonas dokdonensis]KRG71558.1 polyketide cyclase [Pseudoxanthomonas dokdonensis]